MIWTLILAFVLPVIVNPYGNFTYLSMTITVSDNDDDDDADKIKYTKKQQQES